MTKNETTNTQKLEQALEKARHYLGEKQFDNAEKMYFHAQNFSTDSETRAIIWAELSWLYYQHRKYEKAVEAAENTRLHNPYYKAQEDLYRVQGYAYLAMQNASLAEKCLTHSLESDSTSEKQQYVKYELGKLYFIQGNYDLAYPYFKDIYDFFAQKDREYLMSIQFYMGFIYYYLENYTEAKIKFESILAEKPVAQREASALFGLAFLSFREKNYLNTIAVCERILTIDEHFFDKESLGFLTAASYFYLGRKDIFQEYFDQMARTYPNGRYQQDLETLSSMNPGDTESN